MGLKDKNQLKTKQKNKRRKKVQKLVAQGEDPSKHYYGGVYIGTRKD